MARCKICLQVQHLQCAERWYEVCTVCREYTWILERRKEKEGRKTRTTKYIYKLVVPRRHGEEEEVGEQVVEVHEDELESELLDRMKRRSRIKHREMRKQVGIASLVMVTIGDDGIPERVTNG